MHQLSKFLIIGDKHLKCWLTKCATTTVIRIFDPLISCKLVILLEIRYTEFSCENDNGDEYTKEYTDDTFKHEYWLVMRQ